MLPPFRLLETLCTHHLSIIRVACTALVHESEVIHTATSLLKNAGVSDVVARDIVGHESEAVSRNYTHIDAETKRAALDKLPELL